MLAAARPMPEADRKALEALLGEIKGALELRNRVIHGLWHVGPDGKPWIVKYSESGKETFRGKVTEAEIHPIAEKVKGLANGLNRWLKARDPQILAHALQ